MGWTFNDTDVSSSYGIGNTSSGVFAVTTGDLIVVTLGILSDTNIEINSISDTAGNSYTLRSMYSDAVAGLQFAYCIGATGHASNIVTISYSNDAAIRKNLRVLSVTPDGGDTVSFDVGEEESAGYEASPWETAGGISTTGTDEFCIAACQSGTGPTMSNFEIPAATAATLLSSGTFNLEAWYRILSATQANIDAQCDSSASKQHSIGLLCFKSVAAAPGGPPIGTLNLMGVGR